MIMWNRVSYLWFSRYSRVVRDAEAVELQLHPLQKKHGLQREKVKNEANNGKN